MYSRNYTLLYFVGRGGWPQRKVESINELSWEQDIEQVSPFVSHHSTPIITELFLNFGEKRMWSLLTKKDTVTFDQSIVVDAKDDCSI